MGIYDRDYMADNKRGRAVFSRSMVPWLLIFNSGAFVANHYLLAGIYSDLFNLSKSSLFAGEWWRLFSFQFFHADWAHLLFNMVFLFFVGRIFERIHGGKWLLSIYLLGGVFGGMAHVLWSPIGFVGASASVFAVFTALVFTIPEKRITWFLLPLNLEFKFVGWLVFFGHLFGVFFPFSGIPFVSHLGGMSAGALLMGLGLRLQDRSEVLNLKLVERKISKIAEAAEIEIKKKRQKETIYLRMKVDSILEKISKEGMESLSPDERKILARTSEKLSRKMDDNV